MGEVKKHEAGTFCWVDLATNDLAGAKRFYTELFGWRTQSQPSPRGEYTFLRLGNDDVAGLMEQLPEQKQQHASPRWLCFVSVEDAQDSAKKAVAAGGTLLEAPRVVGDQGTVAVIQDPTGARLGLWQAKRHTGSRRVDEPGAPCWTELATSDTKKATRFYEQVFGWRAKGPEGPMGYVELELGGKSVAGMFTPSAGQNEAREGWAIYFDVDNLEGTLERAGRLGGKTLVPPKDVPQLGRFAVLEDPQGASFALFQHTR